MKKTKFELPALTLKQNKKELYVFTVDGKDIYKFATISRITRSDSGNLSGYQRPEALAHINEIKEYLESENSILPNPIVVAFKKKSKGGSVQFLRDPDSKNHGIFEISINDGSESEDLPGWIVDGQQRSSALAQAKSGKFPIFVVAFIAKNDNEQREQFILMNNTKPLPSGLIHELLPDTAVQLPEKFVKKKFPSEIVSVLNNNTESVFFKKIRTPTNPVGIIKDTSVMKIISRSFENGILYEFRDPETGYGDIKSIAKILNSYWKAVSIVFEDDWSRPPKETRLTHGAGVVALGDLMDCICDHIDDLENITEDVLLELFIKELEIIKPACSWSQGNWQLTKEISKKWNHIQNISNDINLLSNYLTNYYSEIKN